MFKESLMSGGVGLFELLWSIFLLFLLVAWFWVLIAVVSDIFRSRDMNGFAKALWIGFVIVIPWLGVLSYILLRGDKMQAHAVEALGKAEEERRSYIRSVTRLSPAEELAKLVELREKGALTEEEFAAQKARVLSS